MVRFVILTLLITVVADPDYRETLKVEGAPIQKYLKNTAYKDQIPRFKAELEDIGHRQGWTLTDLQKRFSNKLWDDIVFD